MKRRGNGEGVEIHDVGEVGVSESGSEGGVGFNPSGAVVDSEYTHGIEDDDVWRGGAERAMELEGDEVGSLVDSRGRKNDVEVGEGVGVVEGNGLCVGVEGVDPIETTHLVSVEVDNDMCTSCGR